jgi:hypothetical protein
MRSSRTPVAAAALAAWLLCNVQVDAQTPRLSPALSPVGFLVGRWIAEGGRAAPDKPLRGVSTIEPAVSGQALLRRDHTDVVGPDGAVVQSFDQIMLIYPDAGHLHGDYFDGAHVIHYVDAVIEPEHSVRFTTAPAVGAPAFRLTYEKEADGRLRILFEMQAPGQSGFQTLAEGMARRQPPAVSH